MKKQDIKDPIGKKYERLTIIKEVEPYISPKNENKRKVLCKCECGNEIEVILTKLKNNRIKSCGCINKINIKDLIRKKYSRLTIIREVKPHIIRKGEIKRKVLCKCECGNTKEVRLNDLRNGKIKSCGCLRKENSKKVCQSKEFIKKRRQIRLKNYYNNLFVSDRLKNKVIPLFKLEDYKGLRLNQRIKYPFKCVKCGQTFEDCLDSKIPRCLSCYPLLSGFSQMEKEILEYIKTIYDKQILENDRELLNGQEIDIYLPNARLAIEFNGLHWHSELQGKDKDYHLSKTLACESLGIHLLQIFEDEWLNKQDIVQAKIRAILGQTNAKSVYARNCQVQEISTREKNNFLNKYHIQGASRSRVKLGLFSKENNLNLIAVMTFGGGWTNPDGEYELVRFATANRTIGAAGKLLKHFERNYSPVKIFSFADRRWSFNGPNLYEKIGFTKVSEVRPTYWYIKNGSQRFHKFNFRRKALESKLDVFDAELTEWQNMQLNGWDRVWDCGSLKYEYIIN